MLTLDKCAGIGIVERNKLNILNMGMQKETRQITVPAYRDNDENPCCAADFNSGEVCPFYRTQRFGVNETCVFAKHDGRYAEKLERRKDGHGTLIPCAQCPIWKPEN